MTTFAPSLEDLRAGVDAELGVFLAERRSALPEADALVGELQRLIGAGGKRLRPAFCYWGYRAAGGEPRRAIVKASASLELLHTFAIVHDDIMDASEERRGLPTAHALHGVNFALLAGDFALVLADDMLVTSGFDPAVQASAFAAYSRMRQQVIAGQFLDVQAAAVEDITEGDARRIAVLKSGRYSVREPLAIGAALAQAPPAVVAGLTRFGEPLGEAFQLRDDLLGTFGERAALGKPVDSDIREGKRNVLYAKTIAAVSPQQRAWFTERWGAKESLSPGDVAEVKRLIESCGARAATEALLEDLTARARAELAQLALGAEAAAALEALVEEATERVV